jgi:hypothetical protein
VGNSRELVKRRSDEYALVTCLKLPLTCTVRHIQGRDTVPLDGMASTGDIRQALGVPTCVI